MSDSPEKDGTAAAAADAASARPRAEILEHFVTRDGVQCVIRPLGADDGARELRFLQSLSPQTLYERTLSHRRLQPGELKRLVRYDVRREIALLAATAADDEIIGVVRLRNAQADDGHAPAAPCEFAVVVADGWQQRGVGARLMAKLMELAQQAGIAQVCGHTLATNEAMKTLARRAGFSVHADPEDATMCRLERELNPTGPG